jgi:hypothetical protein
MANKKKTSKKSAPKKAVATPKKTPPKKITKKAPPVDTKKYKAGKVRGSTAIRDSKGRYVSKLFANEVKLTLLASKGIDVKKVHADNFKKIDALIKENKIKPEGVKKFYDKNKFIFEELNEKGKLKGTWKNSNQLQDAIEGYQGEIFINTGTKIKKVTKDEASLIINRFKTSVVGSINAQDFAVLPTFTLSGTMTFNIPSPTKLNKELMKFFGIEDIEELDEFDAAEISEALTSVLESIYGGEPDLVLYIS